MTDKDKIKMYAVLIYDFMELEAEKYKKQVKRGETSQEWLDGYMQGIDEYRKSIITSKISIL